jgi:hypothetical protein
MNVQAGAAKHRSRRSDAARWKVLQKRLALADELARTPTTTVTLRLPTGLNRWLDGYVHGAWPAKIRKQELVVEAMRLLIACRGGAHEDVLAIGLVEEDQTRKESKTPGEKTVIARIGG